MQHLIGTVSETAVGLDQTARELSASAQDSAERAGETAEASSAATDSVQTVASAAEELSASIAEISRQVGQTTQVVAQATEGTHATNEKIAGLAQAASKIGEVFTPDTDSLGVKLAQDMLNGNDEFCANYIQAWREKKI